MTAETLKKMNKITKNEAEKFIKSDLKEEDYYKIITTELKSLSTYLNELRDKRLEYENKANDYIKRIKEKNDWVLGIEPSFNRSNVEIVALAPNYPNIGISENQKKEGTFKITGGYSETFLFESRRKRREEIINNSELELKEIKNIINEVDYKKEKEGIITCSNNYLISPEDFSSIIIRTRDMQLYKLFKSKDQYKLYSFLTKKTTEEFYDTIKKFTLKK